jgi:hypothetical protein
MKLNSFIANKKGKNDANYSIYSCQNEFQTDDVAEMLFQQMLMLCNIFIVIIGNAKIEKNV